MVYFRVHDKCYRTENQCFHWVTRLGDSPVLLNNVQCLCILNTDDVLYGNTDTLREHFNEFHVDNYTPFTICSTADILHRIAFDNIYTLSPTEEKRARTERPKVTIPTVCGGPSHVTMRLLTESECIEDIRSGLGADCWGIYSYSDDGDIDVYYCTRVEQNEQDDVDREGFLDDLMDDIKNNGYYVCLSFGGIVFQNDVYRLLGGNIIKTMSRYQD